MREIEFRGKRVDNGEYVYGDLVHMTGGRVGIIFDKRVAAVEVEPNSVAQLVGRDANGKKVYEGDVLITRSGFECQARWYPSYLSGHTLKEA